MAAAGYLDHLRVRAAGRHLDGRVAQEKVGVLSSENERGARDRVPIVPKTDVVDAPRPKCLSNAPIVSQAKPTVGRLDYAMRREMLPLLIGQLTIRRQDVAELTLRRNEIGKVGRSRSQIIANAAERGRWNERPAIVDDEAPDGGIRQAGQDHPEQPAEGGPDPVDPIDVEARKEHRHINAVLR